MDSVGQLLKAARERRRLSVAEVAAATRIKIEYIEAVEANRFQELPAPVYARGFLRMIAGAVGLDPQDLLRRYEAAAVRRAPPAPVAVPTPDRPSRPTARRWLSVRRLGLRADAWTRWVDAGRARLAVLWRKRTAWRRPTVPAWVWPRAVLLAGVGLVILAAVLAGIWTARGLPAVPDAGRRVAEPREPYLADPAGR